MENDQLELYKKYRPQRWNDLVGQTEVVTQLKGMIENKTLPHTLLITGPSGCGKTTIARIIKEELAVGESDYQEVDCADNNGIDTVRALKSRINAAPLSGHWRMFLLDECHQLTTAAQDSLLKLLEDTPRHVFFLLNTTDPRKLKDTIRTRCTEIKVKSLPPDGLRAVLLRIMKKEKIKLEEEVVDKIIATAQGSARRALVSLHQVQGMETADEQLELIAAHDEEVAGIDLARKLMDLNATWGDVAAVLKSIEHDAETCRRIVLGYAAAILLNQSKQSKIGLRAALILESFEDNVFDSGRHGLVLRAWNVFCTPQR